MKCLKKIIHRPQIYLGFCALLLSVFLSFGLSSDSHATSGSCTVTGTLSSSYRVNIPISDCVSGSYWFRLDSFSYSFSSSFSNVFVSISSITPNPTGNFSVFSSLGTSGTFSDFSSHFVPNFYYSGSTIIPDSSTYNNFVISFGPNYPSGSGSVTVSFTYTDNLADFVSGSGSCPEPTPCPSIPENPYDDKLDAIKTAIYACGASLFVIYFFVCIYKIIVKDGGSRK